MSEFEKAKQEIMELLESAINDELVCKKLRELKPPAPPAIREDIMQLIEGELISLRESQRRTGGTIDDTNKILALKWVKSLCEVKNEQ